MRGMEMTIEDKAQLISSVARDIENSMWSDEILARLVLIEKACDDLRKMAERKRSGER